MTEAEWLACDDPERMQEFIRSNASERKSRLLAVACCRSIEWLIPKSPPYPFDARQGFLVSERFADGNATLTELSAAFWECDRCCRLQRGEPFRDVASENLNDVIEVIVESGNSSVYIRSPDDDDSIMTHGDLDKNITNLIRDIFGNPFRQVTFSPEWRTDTAVSLARQMYDARDFSAMPILADALQDAGCDNDDILSHCRGEGPHVRGCWVIDLVLGLS